MKQKSEQQPQDWSPLLAILGCTVIWFFMALSVLTVDTWRFTVPVSALLLCFGLLCIVLSGPGTWKAAANFATGVSIEKNAPPEPKAKFINETDQVPLQIGIED